MFGPIIAEWRNGNKSPVPQALLLHTEFPQPLRKFYTADLMLDLHG